MSLMPVLAQGLPEDLLDGVVRAITDPARFATPRALPTVAASDPDFSERRMWRGPVWVNTNWLVGSNGLRLQGQDELRGAVERSALELVREGGPHEYFNPLTGTKPPRATTCFGWSAALAVDLAVGLSHSA